MAARTGFGQFFTGQGIGSGYGFGDGSLAGDGRQIAVRVVSEVGNMVERRRRRGPRDPPLIVEDETGGIASRIGDGSRVSGGIVPELGGEVQAAVIQSGGNQVAGSVVAKVSHHAVRIGFGGGQPLAGIGEDGHRGPAADRRPGNGQQVAVPVVPEAGGPVQGVGDRSRFVERWVIGDGGGQGIATGFVILGNGQRIVFAVVSVFDKIAFGHDFEDRPREAVEGIGRGPAGLVRDIRCSHGLAVQPVFLEFPHLGAPPRDRPLLPSGSRVN